MIMRIGVLGITLFVLVVGGLGVIIGYLMGRATKVRDSNSISSDSRYCKSCGYRITDFTSSYCEQCGAKLNKN